MGTRSSKLLIDESPLQVLPSMAVAIGLNEAIIVQQLHYRLQLDKHVYDEKSWVYYTYEQWQKEFFPFWSADTIKRSIHHLEALGIIEATTRYNRNPIDKTKWYTLCYDRLNAFCPTSTGQDAPTTGHLASTTVHLASMDDASCPARRCILHPLPKRETKILDQDSLLSVESTPQVPDMASATLPGETVTATPPVTPTPVQPPKPVKAKPSRRAPSDYVPSPTVYVWAADECPGVDVDAEVGGFKDHEYPRPYTDWDATFRNWLRTAYKRLQEQRPSYGSTGAQSQHSAAALAWAAEEKPHAEV